MARRYTDTIYNIPGTPLSKLTWRKPVNRVVIEFREGTSADEQRQFLFDLENAIKGYEIDE